MNNRQAQVFDIVFAVAVIFIFALFIWGLTMIGVVK